MAKNAEEVILKLNTNIAAVAAASTSALATLEAQIVKEQQSLAGLEGKLASTAEKFRTLTSGAGGSVSIGAVQKAQEQMASLQGEIDKTQAGLQKLEGARGLAGQATKMEEAKQAITSAGDAVRELQAKLELLGNAKGPNAGEIAKVTAEIEKQSAAVRSAQDAYVKMGGKSKDAVDAAGNIEGTVAKLAKTNFGELGESIGKLGGPLGAAGAQVGRLGAGFQKLAALGPVGMIGALVVAVVALGVAIAAGAVAIAKWAVGMADANRSAQLLSAGIAGTAQGGAELEAAIYRLGTQVPQTAEELRSMAADLKKSGVSAAELPKALEEAAIKAAKLKWGPDFAKQTVSLENLSRRFGDNLKAVFGGLKIEGLLQGLKKLVALFDANSASGKALKVLFEKLFQPLIDGAAAAIPYVERVFLTAVVWALRAYIALKPYEAQIKAVAIGLAIVAAVVGGTILASFAALGAAVAVVVGAWFALQSAGQAVGAWLAGVPAQLSALGSALMTSLAGGITGSAGAVVAAITGAVGGAINAAKTMLGIASPSKVFTQIGAQTAQGMAGGVDDGAPEAAAATDKMARGAVQAGAAGASSAAPAAGASGGGKGGHVVEFNNCMFGAVDKSTITQWVLEALDIASRDAEPAT